MMASLLLSKAVFAACSVIFQGFEGDKQPIKKSSAISIMPFFPLHYSNTFDIHFKSRVIYPYDWKCSMHFWKWVHCPVQIRLQMQDMSLWNRSLTNSAVSPGAVGEECVWMEAFETSLFNIGAAVTSVRWHFGSTIKIQQWPCCFDNQLSMHNIPPVCATWISPGPGFSSALILKKRETFHSTLKKERNALCADKGGNWGSLWEKENRYIGADIYLHYLERSSNWFHPSDCELSTMTIS